MQAILIGGRAHGEVRDIPGTSFPGGLPLHIDSLRYDENLLDLETHLRRTYLEGWGFQCVHTRYTYLGIQDGEMFYYGVV